MTKSESYAFVATLQAAFPAGNAGDETAHLYAAMFEQHEAEVVRKAVQALVETRTDPFLPTWAEVSATIRACKPKPKQLEEPDGVPMPAETRAAIKAMFASGEAKGKELEQGAAA